MVVFLVSVKDKLLHRLERESPMDARLVFRVVIKGVFWEMGV